MRATGADVHKLKSILPARKAPVSLEQTRGMEFNPLTQRYWLSGDTSVNYLIATRRP